MGALERERAVGALLKALPLEAALLDERSSRERTDIERVLAEPLAAASRFAPGDGTSRPLNSSPFGTRRDLHRGFACSSRAARQRTRASSTLLLCGAGLRRARGQESLGSPPSRPRSRRKDHRTEWEEVLPETHAVPSPRCCLYSRYQTAAEFAPAPFRPCTHRLNALLAQAPRAWRAGLALPRIPITVDLRNEAREAFVRHLPAIEPPDRIRARRAPVESRVTKQSRSGCGYSGRSHEADGRIPVDALRRLLAVRLK